jgi:hypothetical protein
MPGVENDTDSRPPDQYRRLGQGRISHDKDKLNSAQGSDLLHGSSHNCRNSRRSPADRSDRICRSASPGPDLHHPSEGGWTESVIYAFPFDADPYGGLIFDQIGNLYGITNGPTQDQTVVYELTPAGSGWTFNQLYSFYVGSFAKLTMDPAGNLYGTLFAAGLDVFRLTPSNGQWTQTGFTGGVGDFRYGSVILDASGNVYATASGAGSYGVGAVFEITL